MCKKKGMKKIMFIFIKKMNEIPVRFFTHTFPVRSLKVKDILRISSFESVPLKH